MKAIKTIAKIFFYSLFLLGFVCIFGEAESMLMQLVWFGASLSMMYVSYRALRSLGCFE